MADLRDLVADVVIDYVNEYKDEEVFDFMNKASTFAYFTIQSYLEGPNKDTRLFLDDVRVVLETDPLTSLNLIYLVRGDSATPHQKQRVKELVSYDGFEISMDSDIFDIGTRINDVVDKLQDQVEEFFINNEDLGIDSYEAACDFLTSEELEQMRLRFGFNTPVDDERIFSDNDTEILEWIRETKSYHDWADRACDNIVIDMQNHGSIKDIVLREIPLEGIIKDFEGDYEEFKRKGSMEWEGSYLRVWYNKDDLDQPDFHPDDLDLDDDLDPDIIYSNSADSFIRFDNTIKIKQGHDDRYRNNYITFENGRFLFINTGYFYSKDYVSGRSRREIGLLAFLNPDAHLKLFVYLDLFIYNNPDRNVNIKKILKESCDNKKDSEACTVASFFTSFNSPHRLTLKLRFLGAQNRNS